MKTTKKYMWAAMVVMCCVLSVEAQVRCSATADSGSGYSAFASSGFEIENPDCRHGDFGAHITMTYDELLDRNVFEFHSHIAEDTDRCVVEDRIRMEVKGGPNSNEELKHPEGSTSYYRWKFKVPADFMGASSFCHIFQDKIKGGDDSFPVITFTLRTDILEVRHNGGDSGVDLDRLVSVDLDKVSGKWIEAYLSATHAENGQLTVTLKDMSTQEVILEYENNDIDLWRDGGDYSRPKYGIYRSRNSILKDEVILFADFCVSETSADLCPADTFIIKDNTAPTVPTGLAASDIMINSVNLSWDASSDDVGVERYVLYQDGIVVYEGSSLSTVVETEGSTTYSFSVAAVDGAGNSSDRSPEIIVTTDDINSLPAAPSNVSPQDGASGTLSPAFLNWNPGENTDDFTIYLGKSETPDAVASQVATGYSATDLEENTTYYWRIGANNANGETLGALWSFTTGSASTDFPWMVYRADARMEVETDFMTQIDRPLDPDVDLVFEDPAVASNSLYSYYEEEEEKFRWRNTFSETDTAFTVVARVKALNTDVNCVCYFEVRGFGFREKVRINQSTVKLERSSPVVENDLPFDIAADFHVVRMTMTGNKAYIYLDENPTPFAIGSSTTSDTNFNFEWGKSGSNACGGTIDWLTILHNQAVAPGEGPDLPADLIVNTSVDVQETVAQPIHIYPKPTSDYVTLTWSGKATNDISLLDINGNLLLKKTLRSGDQIDMTQYPVGTYLIIMKNKRGQQSIQKIVKTN